MTTVNFYSKIINDESKTRVTDQAALVDSARVAMYADGAGERELLLFKEALGNKELLIGTITSDMDSTKSTNTKIIDSIRS
ncbi:hypothetical protein [Acerihabitans sp.]|uniref:hypothetical protein n=1 Tax=Acerihabitans sp. TaxID=2811394 RepID=UPI002ED92884